MTQLPFEVELNEAAVGPRVLGLHREVLATRPAVSAERAVLITRYRRSRAARRRVPVLRASGALAYLLDHRTVRIHPDELLVGNFSAQRVGGELFPELHGIPMLEDLFRFDARPVNPLRIDAADRRQLLTEVLPFWATRFLAMKIRPRRRIPGFLARQLAPIRYLINETGGISHFVPDYERLLALGTSGLRALAERQRDGATAGPAQDMASAAIEVCHALERWAARYAAEARRMAGGATGQRQAELLEIAAICNRVPAGPATTLREALQSILFVQIALNCESLDNSVSPGRLDQLLWPHYRGDRDPAGALELLGCFAVKLCELVPVFSERLTRFHGGMFNGQVVVVGGTDRDGRDATNPLSTLFVRLMGELRTRQPNYHARFHADSPPGYRAQVARVLADGAASPAVYNDAVIVPALVSRGIALEDARDYANVGCVEPVAAGKSYLSTDAALVNLPLCLELALNEGRRFGARTRMGARTRPIGTCRSTAEVLTLFDTQVRHLLGTLLADLHLIEDANAREHPTPLTSVMLDGCIETLQDASRGGARYNGSGVQGVGAVEVGDSLAAIERVVFGEQRATLSEVRAACRTDFAGCDALQAWLRRAPKFGNDDPNADVYTGEVMRVLAQALEGHVNRRGGRYVAGFYSVTSHVAFGEEVGALPSGRPAGAPFSSGLSPTSGHARRGPTAALLSLASLPVQMAPNGVNFNLELSPLSLRGGSGPRHLQGLIDGGFAAGCMQLQVNVLDRAHLVEARDHPGRYPGLLVRVSGYSAYFDDLSPTMKQEIIDRLSDSE